MARRHWWLGLATSVALAAIPASAVAAEQTFCVQDPGCVGSAQPTIAAALQAADDNGPERDRIQIGPGTFSSGATLADATDNPVDIRGAGPASTVITRTAAVAQIILSLSHPSSSVSNLNVHLQPGHTGLALDNGALGERLRVTSAPGMPGSTGVLVTGGSVLRGSVVSMHLSANSTGVNAVSSLLESNGISAHNAVTASGSGGRITGHRITARLGVLVLGGSANASSQIDNTQITTLAGGSDEVAVRLNGACCDNTTVTLTARHLTLLGPGSDTALWSRAIFGSGGDAVLDVRDTLVRGYATDLTVEESAGDDASSVIDWSAYDFTKTSTSGGAQITTGPQNLNLSGVDPLLRSFFGDMRPGFDSPLVDRGVPGALLGSEATLDLARLPRLVDGDGDGTAGRDIGAFEYQRTAPALTVTPEPATVGVGEQVSFSASATDSDPEEVPGPVAWSFDDGTTATGDSVQHAFATPGPHSATATAVDPAGVAGSATATIVVSAPPDAPAPPGDGSPPPAPGTLGDLVAPALTIGTTAVRLTRAGVARVPLTCPAAETSGPCVGTLTLTTARKVAARAAPGRGGSGSAPPPSASRPGGP